MSFTWDELDQMRPKGDWRSPLPPTCSKCSYVLTGLPEQRCPECGTPFNWKEVRQRASRTWARTVRLQHANQDARTGICLALGGWALLGVVQIIFADFHGVVRVIDFIAGVMAIILGSQALNIRRVPRYARAFAGNPPPSVLLGALAMLLGLLLMVGVFLV